MRQSPECRDEIVFAVTLLEKLPHRFCVLSFQQGVDAEHLAEKGIAADDHQVGRRDVQIVQRDRHAEYFSVLALIASSLEKFAVEIRHLQRTEVLEAEEFFSKGQKGSSAMPHKRNPVLSENLTGLSRLIRGYAVSAMENVALWHERDISHSSVERVIGPDGTILIDFMLNRCVGLIENLVVYPENMQKNLNQMRGLIFSQRVLLKLANAGASREQAYSLVQRNAMKVWEQGKDFLEELLADAEVRGYLPEEEIREAFDLGYHMKHVDTIFKRVFGE